MKSEIWADIPGWPGYEVSDFGRVRSLDRLIEYQGRHGLVSRMFLGRLMKCSFNNNGYPVVCLSGGEAEVQYAVHQLVMLAFCGPREDGMVVCHINGDRSDNHLGNLRYDTRAGTHANKVLLGSSSRGERNHKSKLTIEQVREIRSSSARGSDLSSRFSVSEATISSIRNLKTWSWLS